RKTTPGDGGTGRGSRPANSPCRAGASAVVPCSGAVARRWSRSARGSCTPSRRGAVPPRRAPPPGPGGGCGAPGGGGRARAGGRGSGGEGQRRVGAEADGLLIRQAVPADRLAPPALVLPGALASDSLQQPDGLEEVEAVRLAEEAFAQIRSFSPVRGGHRLNS